MVSVVTANALVMWCSVSVLLSFVSAKLVVLYMLMGKIVV